MNSMMMKLRIAVVAMTAWLATTAYAQMGILYDSDSHISSSLVRSAYQDSRGMLWVATNNGLNIYDGYDFYSLYKTHGLNSNVVNHVTEDEGGHIYVCQANSIQVIVNDKLLTVTEDGKTKNCFVSHAIRRKDGTIIYATSGLGLHRITGLTTSEQILSSERALDFTRKLMEDKDGRLWAVTEDNGVICIDHNNRLTRYFDNIDLRGIMSDICQDCNGNIYAGCNNHGVYVKRKGEKAFTLIPQTEDIPVTSLMPKNNKTLMIGTNGQGLKLLDIQTGTVRNSTFYTYKTNLSRTKVGSITRDKDGNIWLGLFQKGLFVQMNHKSQFGYIGKKMPQQNLIGDECVMAVHQTADGILWVGTDGGGLYALNTDGGYRQEKHFAPQGKSNSIPSAVLCIAEDENKRLWIGSYTKGCGWVDTETGEYHRLPWSYGKATAVFEIIADKKGHLWIGTLGDGLKMYDIATGKTVSYKSRGGTKQCLPNDYIMQMRLSRNGKTLYIGTSMGLAALDIPSGSWTKTFGTNLMLENNNVTGIKEDKKGRLWIGGDDSLFMIERKGKTQITSYTTEQGLPSSSIADIQEDKTGKLWISTKKGLCCLEPSTGAVTNYYANDGLQSNEFCEGVSLCLSDNRLLFGGMQGITVFTPEDITPRQQKLDVVLSAMEIGSTIVRAGMKSGNYVITDTIVAESSRFDLSHQDNTVTLRLSTLTFKNQERTMFRYSIDSGKWSSLAEGTNRLTLTHLTPGTYNIRIQATLNGAHSKVKEITIVVHHPWYFSWWAKTIYLLIIIYVCWWLYRNMKARQQDKLDLQKHIHAEEMNDAKLRFFIDLSHEIRTPMTLITSPLGDLMAEDNDPHRNAIYATIRRNAERILHIVNQIMDMRKIDKGQMKMQMQETDIVGFINEICSLFAYTARNKGINLSFMHDGIDKLSAWVDRTALDKVMMNLLSNAMKYTPNGKNVVIGLEHDSKNMRIYVSNDGQQIPEDQLEKIFMRFYQAKGSNTKPGTGVGLDLARSLTELQHGTIHAENVPGGCKFVIELPLGYAHLTKEEIMEKVQKQESSTAETQNENDITSTGENANGTLPEAPEENAEQTGNTEKEENTGNADNTANAEDTGKAPKKQVKPKLQTIVIAEDDDEIRQYIAQTLSSTFRVLICADGAEALPVVQKELPALVITDVMMPRMDGNELCTKIKSNIRTNHIPVIMLTAKAMDNDVLEGLETGADAYITKPFNMDILKRTIINKINSRRVMEKKFSGEESQNDKVEKLEITTPDQKLMTKIMDVINANISNSDLSVDMIAQSVGLSRVHLHRKMKELTNQTPHDFIRNIRMQQAAKLLEEGNHNITEIVYKCGFSNTTSFSTMFKKMYGQTPRDYMKDK